MLAASGVAVGAQARRARAHASRPRRAPPRARRWQSAHARRPRGSSAAPRSMQRRVARTRRARDRRPRARWHPCSRRRSRAARRTASRASLSAVRAAATRTERRASGGIALRCAIQRCASCCALRASAASCAANRDHRHRFAAKPQHVRGLALARQPAQRARAVAEIAPNPRGVLRRCWRDRRALRAPRLRARTRGGRTRVSGLVRLPRRDRAGQRR